MATKGGMVILAVCLAGFLVATSAEGAPPPHGAGMQMAMGHHPFHHYYPSHHRSYGPPSWHRHGPRGPVVVPVPVYPRAAYPRGYRYAPYSLPGNYLYYGGPGWGMSFQF